ncbi:MAG: DUF523 domain-containing protein [Patescibacteria group bacterium]|nr:DUF523 domain-containing protein [Patescibacteria group bacterium]
MNNKCKPKLISACLLGIKCRWDAKFKPCQKAIELFKQGQVIPVCPEQLGGLPTPRIPQEIQKDGRVLNKEGREVTEEFKKGASETLRIAKLLGVKEFIGKSKSPSCGFGKTYDGTFSGTLVKGNGVTADLLSKNGIKVITEKNL